MPAIRCPCPTNRRRWVLSPETPIRACPTGVSDARRDARDASVRRPRCTMKRVPALVLTLAAIGCCLPSERDALKPLAPEGRLFTYREMIARALRQATAAVESFYIDAWTELEQAAGVLEQTARFLPHRGAARAPQEDARRQVRSLEEGSRASGRMREEHPDRQRLPAADPSPDPATATARRAVSLAATPSACANAGPYRSWCPRSRTPKALRLNEATAIRYNGNGKLRQLCGDWT